jgi:hypothetical protein
LPPYLLLVGIVRIIQECWKRIKPYVLVLVNHTRTPFVPQKVRMIQTAKCDTCGLTQIVTVGDADDQPVVKPEGPVL